MATCVKCFFVLGIVLSILSPLSAQSITTVEPNSAQQGDNLMVTITGQDTNFTQGSTTVWFTQGSSTIWFTQGSSTVLGNTSLSAYFEIPSDAELGAWDVVVDNTVDGELTLIDGFSVAAALTPELSFIIPDSAQQGDSLSVAIIGQNTNFLQGSSTVTSVWFSQGSSTINASSFSVTNGISVSANFDIPVDATTGRWDVRVDNTVDGELTLIDGFSVVALIPELSSITPEIAQQGDSLIVTISGENTNFMQGSSTAVTAVWFAQGGSSINASSFWADSATSVSAFFDIPNDATVGIWDIFVISSIDGTLTKDDGFTIEVRSPTILYVDNDASGDPGPNDPFLSNANEDGSLQHPFDAIQEAIDIALEGDTVVVLDGTYSGQGNRDIDFNGLAITVKSENGPETCIIDCNEQGCGFIFDSGEDSNSVLNGFMIINGSGFNQNPWDSYGGGVYCESSAPAINHCIIKDNFATYGGGLWFGPNDQVEFAKLVASDAAEYDYFGGSVAIDGNIAIVGGVGDDSPSSESGSAYLIDVTTGAQLYKLTALDAAENDNFGYSVAIDSNIAIVGAPFDDIYGYSSGSAYLFDVTTGMQLAKLWPSVVVSDEKFGYSVAIEGNIAVVGTPYDYDGGIRSGSVYLFDVTTGTELRKLRASDAEYGDYFGRSVAIDAGTVIVGAVYDDRSGGISSGSAYLFDVTTGTQLYKLTASDAGEYYYFGRSVAIDGNIAIVGADGDDHGGSSSGSAYLFDVTTGAQVCKLIASDAAEYDRFGNSVAIDGDMAIIGACDDISSGISSGSAYLFDIRTGTQLAKLRASDAMSYGDFGESVAIDGNMAIVGSPYDDDGGDYSGSAYLFDAVLDSVKARPVISNSVVTENMAEEGGGIFGSYSNAMITNCVITGNYAFGASHGGGISVAESDMAITNSTIAGNIAELYGGGIDCRGGNLTIDNCILWDNAAVWGDGVYTWDEGIVTINYSDMEGGQSAFHTVPGSTVNWGTGNIDIEPVFVDAGYWDLGNWIDGDYHLQADSVCINAGDPNYSTDANDLDIEGNRRVSGGRVDIGAYEFTAELVLDLDGDGVVNFVDFAILVFYWDDYECLWPDWCEGSDADESGIVDYDDLLLLCERWLDEYPVMFYCEPLDTNPGWGSGGGWAYGQPEGNGGSQYGNPDPVSGYTGTNVFGVNLRGDYSTVVGGPYYLTAGPIDCNGFSNVELKFARWLNSDDPAYVTGTIEVSDDGATWITAWDNGRGEITDGSWIIMKYDISSVADNQETVYIRWGYEVFDNTYPYSGWNIDDIELWGNQ